MVDVAARVSHAAINIARAIKRHLDAAGTHDVAHTAVACAIAQLKRPEGPRLSNDEWQQLARALTTRARLIAPPNSWPTTRAIYDFAKDAAKDGWRLHHAGRSPSTSVREKSAGADLKAAAKAAVYAELLHANNDDDLVRRAVTRALHERRRGLPGRRVPLSKGDPLRALLSLPEAGQVRVPHSDVRGVVADAAMRTPEFGALLRTVSVFSRDVIEEAIGAELWRLCRPAGFSDAKHTRVLVVTPSSIAAQETQLRANELHHRLKQIPALSHIVGVKVQIDARAFANLRG